MQPHNFLNIQLGQLLAMDILKFIAKK